MLNEPRWLRFDEIIAINKLEVGETGEPFFLREEGLLHSAVARPLNKWCYGEVDVVVLAVALIDGIVRNHCFEQGNKRTASTSALTFLEFNGYEWIGPDTARLGVMIEGLIIGRVNEARLVRYIKRHLRRV